jgi:hypothetical protein
MSDSEELIASIEQLEEFGRCAAMLGLHALLVDTAADNLLCVVAEQTRSRRSHTVPRVERCTGRGSNHRRE